MSIKANQEQSTGNYEKKLWQGNALVKVLAVNPTLAELNKLGVGIKTEPNYKNDNFGKVTFWIENATTGKFPINFLINTPKVSTKDTWELIDKYGSGLWCTKEGNQYIKPEITDSTNKYYAEKITNFDMNSARLAYGGEINLTDFIKAWGDLQDDKVTKVSPECTLDTMDKIVKSDVGELKSLLASIPAERTVWVCLGVKDGLYQEFYNRKFARHWNKEPNVIINDLNKAQSLKFHFGSSPYSLQEFNGNGATVGNRVAATSDLPF